MKIIKVVLGSTGVSAQVIAQRAGAAFAGMMGNPNFSAPPVDLALLKTAHDELLNALAIQPTGGTVATAEKNKKLEVVVHMLRQLGHYVEEASKGDLAILLSSGFQAVSTSRTPQPVSTPKILRTDNGNTGQLLISVQAIRGSRNYELRYVVAGTGAAPGSWTNATFTSSKSMVVNGLTPGTAYTFQARALGSLGYSDWSDPVTRICV